MSIQLSIYQTVKSPHVFKTSKKQNVFRLKSVSSPTPPPFPATPCISPPASFSRLSANMSMNKDKNKREKENDSCGFLLNTKRNSILTSSPFLLKNTQKKSLFSRSSSCSSSYFSSYSPPICEKKNTEVYLSAFFSSSFALSPPFFTSLHPSASSLCSTSALASSKETLEKKKIKKEEEEEREQNIEKLCTKKVFFFPGQGAQYVGMGVHTAKKYASAKKLYDRASEILNVNLLDICENGPKDILDKTDICQPAIFVASMAALEKLKQEAGEEEAMSGDVCLGLSLGEYSALCYSGAISFEEGVLLTKERGKNMQICAEKLDTKTGMLAVIGLNKTQVIDLCTYTKNNFGEDIYIANFLCDGNYVLSGSIKACEAAEKAAKSEFKARMCVPLSVAGAFHTKYMQPAVSKFSEFLLHKCDVRTPRIPIISNVDAQPHNKPNIIKKLLIKQITNPVLWEDSIKYVIENGYEGGYEVGPGKVIKGILKRIDKNKNIINVE